MGLIEWLVSSHVSFRIIVGLFIVEYIDESIGWWWFFTVTYILVVCAELLSMVCS